MIFSYSSLSQLASSSNIGLLVATWAAVLTAAYISALYIYNIYFHPLRTYPGPKLFAAYRTPYVYNQLRGRLPLRAKELHDLYGPVVRIAPDELSYITAPAWKDIFGFRPGHSQLPKDLIIFPPLRQGQSADIARSDDANHSRQRRLLSHAFSKKALEEQHSMIISYVDLLVRRLHENAAKPQDLMAWYNWTTFDIIGNLAFGESFSCLEDQRFHPWVKTILVSINGGVAISAARRYGLGNLLVRLIPKSTIEKFELLHSYAKEKIARRLERGTERPDFMSHMMRNDHDRKEMSQSEIESTAVTIVIAGSETTAALLSGATYHLMMNPKLLRQVSEEVRNAFLSEKDIDCTTVGKLEFLSAVLKESLRIYPPAPSSMPRKVIGKGGDFIDGKWVPPNTTVGLFQWACNHSASNFHDPDSFHPERWFDDPPPEFAADSREAMQPFSLGPRNCIGKNLAYVEMRIIMAKMLWNFDLSLEEESKDWMNQKVYLIWAKHPLMAKLTPVKR